MKHKQFARLVGSIVALMLLVACDRGSQDAAGAESAPAVAGPAAKVLARVDERPITAAQVEAFARMRGRPDPTQEVKDWALGELVNLNLLAAEAETAGLVDEAELQVQRVMMLANRAAAQYARANPVTDAELSAEYERQVGLTGRREYRLEHILLPDRAQASAAIARLAGGEDFASLLAEYAGEIGAANAGDLGWVNLAQVPAAFAEPVKALSPGAYAPTPIQSEYGWHVVKLSGVRDYEPPAFEEIKEGIRNTLTRLKMEQHLAALRAAADVSELVSADR